MYYHLRKEIHSNLFSDFEGFDVQRGVARRGVITLDEIGVMKYLETFQRSRLPIIIISGRMQQHWSLLRKSMLLFLQRFLCD